MSGWFGWDRFLSLLPLIFSVVSTLLVVLVIFGSQMMNAARTILRLNGSRLRSSSLRDSSRPVWEWITRWNGKWHGWAKAGSMVVPVACLVVMLGASVYVPLSNRIGVPVTEMNNVRVISPVGDFSYWLEDEQGRRLFATFCDSIGYPPPFDAGETILKLKFRNIGTCWDMRDMHPKYVMKRNPNGDVSKEN